MQFGSQELASMLVGAGTSLLLGPSKESGSKSDRFTRKDFSPETATRLEANNSRFFNLDSKKQRAIIKQETTNADQLAEAKDGLVRAVREDRVQVADDGRASTQSLTSGEHRLLASALANASKSSKNKATKLAI